MDRMITWIDASKKITKIKLRIMVVVPAIERPLVAGMCNARITYLHVFQLYVVCPTVLRYIMLFCCGMKQLHFDRLRTCYIPPANWVLVWFI